jgi:hypothetical protein
MDRLQPEIIPILFTGSRPRAAAVPPINGKPSPTPGKFAAVARRMFITESGLDA